MFFLLLGIFFVDAALCWFVFSETALKTHQCQTVVGCRRCSAGMFHFGMSICIGDPWTSHTLTLGTHLSHTVHTEREFHCIQLLGAQSRTSRKQYWRWSDTSVTLKALEAWSIQVAAHRTCVVAFFILHCCTFISYLRKNIERSLLWYTAIKNNNVFHLLYILNCWWQYKSGRWHHNK